ncbi:MAG: hypothetical protein ACPGES_01670 [Coraliomargarita sp.]
MNQRFHELMHKYILGEVTEEEFREFEQFLEQDAELRQEYLNYTMLEADLRSVALEEQVAAASKRTIRFPVWAAAAAAAILLIIPALMLFNQPVLRSSPPVSRRHGRVAFLRFPVQNCSRGYWI